MGRDNGDPMNTLKPQPGQQNQYHPKFHQLPGEWAKSQIERGNPEGPMLENAHSTAKPYRELYGESSQTTHGSQRSSRPMTEIGRALAAERQQHEYWEKWQGVTPGKPVYEDPRHFQNTLLPVAKYGTDGRGD